MTHVTLFIPGPSEVREDILHAQTAPMIGHRSDECNALIGRVESKLQQVFMTNSRVYILASSGSGLQEAAIRNGVRDGRTVVNFVNGAFAQRWHNVSLGCGKQAVRVDIPWGAPVTPEAVDAALAALDGSCDAITVVQNETSTGVRSPVGKIAALVHDKYPDTLVLVDAVSSLSGDWIPVDEWELDVCLTSSQKALALPPGLAFCSVSDRALARAADVKGRGWYFDFLTLEKALKKNTTPATPAISLMRSLGVQLDRIFAEGVEARYARHARLAERTRRWAVENGFDLMAERGYASQTVTTVTNTRSISVKALNAFLARHDMEISNGYGDYKDKAFRIAHMGEVQDSDMERLFAAMNEFLAGQN